MDTFLTTYRKDFRWPIGPSVPHKTLRDSNELENKLDNCCKEIVEQRLPKPEINPIQLCSIPRAANTENQPDGFLSQLYDTYPFLYNIKKGPTDDTQRNVYSKRFITTYQRDFCKEGDIEEKEKTAKEKTATCCCKTSKEQLKDDNKLSRLIKPIPKMRTTESKKNGNGNGKKVKGDEDKEPSLSKRLIKPEVSEYTDKYSKTGNMIKTKKLLSRKPK